MVASLREWYRAADFFVVRSPLLPVEQLREWLQPSDAEEEVTNGVDVEGLRTRGARTLWNIYRDTALRDAIFFASPQLHDTLNRIQSPTELGPKLQRCLLRYLLRAAGRETPFGILAGNSVGRVAQDDCFEMPARASFRSHTRVSIAYLTRLMAALAARSDLADYVPHEPSSSLSAVLGNYRIARDKPTSTHQGPARFANTVSEVDRTPALDLVLDLTRQGNSLSEVTRTMQAPSVEALVLKDFCKSLVREGILVPAWLPPITGTDSCGWSIAQLQALPELDSVRVLLEDVRATLASTEASVGGHGECYQRLRERLVAVEPGLSTTQPLQAELVKPAPLLAMSRGLTDRFLQAAELIQRTATPSQDRELAIFRERFSARYGRRLVPLAEALDGDVGVGFGGTEAHVSDRLLADIPFESSRGGAKGHSTVDRARIRLLERALTTASRVVELDSEALELFPRREFPPLTESFAVMARLARCDDGRLLVVTPEVTSPSAVALLGRFCEADPEMHRAVARHAEIEQQLARDVILVDVVYGPSDESINVVTRPPLRSHEIPCGGRSSASPDRRLWIDDLLVGVDGDRVCVYSKRLRKRLAIRVANAHNYSQTSLPTVYRFLGTLQRQDALPSACWSWGALEEAAFLPRIVSGDIVLSLARWQISKNDWAAMLSAPPAELMQRARELRAARGLPRWVTRSEGDRTLIVDLDNVLSVEELLHEARKHEHVSLHELLPGLDQLVLRGPEGHYAGQFVVPFLRRSVLPAEPAPVELAEPSIRDACRQYGPGSTWLYARIYAGKSRHGAILRELRKRVIQPSLEQAATQWFFLPFADPEPHLRVRINGSADKLRNTVLALLQRTLDPLIDQGTVFRFELGTYEPELERYGGPRGVALAERLFFADSEASLDLLEVAGDDDQLRWVLTLVGIDRLLSDCGADLEARAAFASAASKRYGREAGANVETWKVIGDRYRQYAPMLSRWLWESPGTDERLKRVRRILAVRSARLGPIWSQIEHGLEQGVLREPADEQLPLVFAHLHATRMLGVSGRAHELLLYEFLKRQYSAQRAKGVRDHGQPRRSA
ncbi:MAG: lantibiotic dehydratase [Myxococcota bacterium]|nr:lantibiotic dehydratase [Myxococcota bacterium]